MQLGMIGLGRMGGNIVRRLMRARSSLRRLRPQRRRRCSALRQGRRGRRRSRRPRRQARQAPRAVWVMLPAGEITEETVDELAALLATGDIIIDGGNSFYKDDIRRAAALARQGHPLCRCRHHRRRLGPRARLLPDDRRRQGRRSTASIRSSRRWRPGAGDIPRTPGREGRDPRVEQRLYPLPARRRRAFRQDGPQRHRIRPDAGLCRRLRHPAERGVARRCPRTQRFTLDLADIAEVWRRGSVISSWLLDLTASALAADAELAGYSGFVEDSGEGRWTIDGGDRGGGAGRRAVGGALCPLPLARGAHLRREAAVGDAQRLRRPCRAEAARMTAQTHAPSRTQGRTPAPPCAAGDLRRRRRSRPSGCWCRRSTIWPHDRPAAGAVSRSIGVAHIDARRRRSFRRRSRTSAVEGEFAGRHRREGAGTARPADRRYSARRFRRPGDLRRDSAEALDEIGGATTAAIASSIWRRRRRFFATIVERLGEAGLMREDARRLAARHHRKAVRPRSRLGAGAQPPDPEACCDETQIYRIDHFLGKETVQNIMVAALRQRPVRADLEPRPHRPCADHRRRDASASRGAATSTTPPARLRDMVPNHLFQLLAMTAMEPPTSFDADAVRTRKGQGAAMPCIRFAREAACAMSVRGQYGAGAVDGQRDRRLSRRAAMSRAAFDDRDLCRAAS